MPSLPRRPSSKSLPLALDLPLRAVQQRALALPGRLLAWGDPGTCWFLFSLTQALASRARTATARHAPAHIRSPRQAISAMRCPRVPRLEDAFTQRPRHPELDRPEVRLASVPPALGRWSPARPLSSGGTVSPIAGRQWDRRKPSCLLPRSVPVITSTYHRSLPQPGPLAPVASHDPWSKRCRPHCG